MSSWLYGFRPVPRQHSMMGAGSAESCSPLVIGMKLRGRDRILESFLRVITLNSAPPLTFHQYQAGTKQAFTIEHQWPSQTMLQDLL